MTAKGQRIDFEVETFIAGVAGTLPAGGNGTGGDRQPGTSADTADTMLIAHSLRGEGFDASEDGTGRGTPIIPIDMRQASRGATMTNNRAEGSSGGAPGTGIGEAGDPSPTVSTSHPPAIAYAIQAGALRENPDSGPDGIGVQEVGAYTLEARAEVQAVAWGISSDVLDRSGEAACGTAGGRSGLGIVEDVSPTVKSTHANAVATAWQVRRLTPTECHRLQGFPDDHCAIDYRGKIAADGPQYKALGNSWAKPNGAWILARIAERLAA
ncbi:DNA cytosine methyltransferase [Sphingopyxis fribergensis]|uniref:DNA cytosine methyltransferase n=1 Tax=Sphingopyxis fribergensis TaxID=1515612 RepID=UPI00068B273C|nr:DNA cytosine methyltransferase [Sphingopyxis fribergensis]